MAEIEAWVRTKVPEGEVSWAMQLIAQTFTEDTVAIDSSLAGRAHRAQMYRLYDLGIVRTRTVETIEKEGKKSWHHLHHHWLLAFPRRQWRNT